MLDLLERPETTAPPRQWRGVFRCVLGRYATGWDAFEEKSAPEYLGNHEWRETEIFPTAEAAEQFILNEIERQADVIEWHMTTGVILEYPKFVRAEPVA